MNELKAGHAFLPGSFDPPHRGHLKPLIAAFQENAAAFVSFVVVRPQEKKAPLLTTDNSVKLLRMMISDAVAEGILTSDMVKRIGPILTLIPKKDGSANIEAAAKQLGATLMLQGIKEDINQQLYRQNIKVSMAAAGVEMMDVFFVPRDGRASRFVRDDIVAGRVSYNALTKSVLKVISDTMKFQTPKRTEGPESSFVRSDIEFFNRKLADVIFDYTHLKRAKVKARPSVEPN